jgi:DNA repair ATPase RecN
MMTKSFQKLILTTILAVNIILPYNAYTEESDNSKICAAYTADYKHLGKSLLKKQTSLKQREEGLQLLQEELFNISSFYESLNQKGDKLKALTAELDRVDLSASDQAAINAYNKKVDEHNRIRKKYQDDIDKWSSDLLPNKNQYSYKSDIIEKGLSVLQSSINTEEEAISRLEAYIMQECMFKGERG